MNGWWWMSGRAATFDLPELIDTIIKTFDTHKHTQHKFYFPPFYCVFFWLLSLLDFLLSGSQQFRQIQRLFSCQFHYFPFYDLKMDPHFLCWFKLFFLFFIFVNENQTESLSTHLRLFPQLQFFFCKWTSGLISTSGAVKASRNGKWKHWRGAADVNWKLDQSYGKVLIYNYICIKLASSRAGSAHTSAGCQTLIKRKRGRSYIKISKLVRECLVFQIFLCLV